MGIASILVMNYFLCSSVHVSKAKANPVANKIEGVTSQVRKVKEVGKGKELVERQPPRPKQPIRGSIMIPLVLLLLTTLFVIPLRLHVASPGPSGLLHFSSPSA
ncbi:hypothetical protein ABZP36_002543 [Zizania latifolia]